MRSLSARSVAMLLAPILCVACADDDHPSRVVADAGPAATDAGSPFKQDARAPLTRDASADSALDARAGSPADATSQVPDATDAVDEPNAGDASSPAPSDASGPDVGLADAASGAAPSAHEVAQIFVNRCGGCHQNQSSDGFLFDGRLRSTLFDEVEAPPGPMGDPPGAEACRKEARVVRGDANSYLIRKVEIELGRQPSPAVCGAGMPLDTALDEAERRKLGAELERLKLWIVRGAPLE